MNIATDTIILHLSLIDGVGPAHVNRIIDHFGIDNLEQIYRFSSNDCMQQFGINQKNAEKLVAGLASQRLLDQELQLLAKHPVGWMTCLNPDYPELLKTIHIPPTILYWQGVLPNEHALAIVGSRDANAYGKMAIDRIVPDLVAHNFTIVSGGARGADTMAHQKTLDVGGKTVAVLGSGLLKPYPPQNKDLFDGIIERGGALVSTFPLLMEPLAENFPARNRVISGLSRGCIVIQAAAKSGARITADYALSQGREVFAVPGPIDDHLSAGCHELINQGAKLITRAADILIEFGYPAYVYPGLPARQTSAGKQASQDPIEIPTKSPKTSSGQQAIFTPAQLAVPIDPIEAIILQTCQNPCAVDELLEASGLPLITLSKMLFDLQVRGVLTQNMAGLWQRR